MVLEGSGFRVYNYLRNATHFCEEYRMNSTLHKAVASFYNLIYECQAFASTMGRIDLAEQDRYLGRVEGLNWVLDRCQELEDVDMREAKKGQFYITDPQRSLANNWSTPTSAARLVSLSRAQTSATRGRSRSKTSSKARRPPRPSRITRNGKRPARRRSQ